MKGAKGGGTIDLFAAEDLGDGLAAVVPVKERPIAEVRRSVEAWRARLRGLEAEAEAATLGRNAELLAGAGSLLIELGEALVSEAWIAAEVVRGWELADERVAKEDMTRSRLLTRSIGEIVQDMTLLGARMDAEDAARRVERARYTPPGHVLEVDGEPDALEHDGPASERRPCLVREGREPSPECVAWWRNEVLESEAHELAVAAERATERGDAAEDSGIVALRRGGAACSEDRERWHGESAAGEDDHG